MGSVMEAEVLVLASAALHVGFQLTVTTVVYPALLRAEPFAPAHRRHSRAIAPVVVIVYGALLASAVFRVLAGSMDGASWVAVGAAAVAGLTTALVAVPTHGRLEEGRTDALGKRLVRADLVRTGSALVGLTASLTAVLR